MLKNMPMPGKKPGAMPHKMPEEMPYGEEGSEAGSEDSFDLESLGQESESPLGGISDEELIEEMKKRKLSL